MNNKKAQYVRQQARERKTIERQERLAITRFLVKKGYNKEIDIAKFFGVSVPTAKNYIRESEGHYLLSDDVLKIEKIKEETNCSWSEAVSTWHRNKLACFIATAAYGSSFSQQISFFRWFRDNRLLQLPCGYKIIKLYYVFSPDIASYLENREFAKKIVRFFLKLIKIALGLFVKIH